MPKLLQINVTANSGSHGRIAEDLGKSAINNGWKSYIAYGRWFTESQSELIHIGNKLDQGLHGLETRLLDRHGLASVIATKNFIREIERIKPDIIHLHNIHGYYLNYPLLFDFLRISNIPVVWTLHDCWSFTGHCSHFVFNNCMKWKTGCFNCIEKKSYPGSFFIDRSKKNYEDKKKAFTSLSSLVIVPVSSWLESVLHESFLKDSHIKCIHNGIDTSVFKPLEEMSFSQKSNTYNILGVASKWSERKGLKDFIKLRETLPLNYRITLVGLNPRQIKSLPSNIEGINRTENTQDLIKLYNEANVFINPTWEDTFPTTNMEALACGTPVITYNTGGSPESIIDSTGLVVPLGDINALKEGIISICNKGKQTYINDCRNNILDNFDKNNCYQKYLELYQTLLHR